MKNTNIKKTIVTLFISGLSVISYANDNTYTIGVQDYENYLPYSQYKNHVYDGLGRAILDLFAKNKGYVFIYEAYPLKRVDDLYLAGKLDFRFPDNPYWVADKKNKIDIKYSPILKFTDGVLILPKNKGKGLSNIKKLGMPLGFTPYGYLDLVNEGKILIYENSRYDGLYLQVLEEKIDGAYANTRVSRYYWRKINGVNNFSVIYDSDLPHTTDYHYISSIKHKKIIEEIDVFLKYPGNKAAIDELKRIYEFDSEE